MLDACAAPGGKTAALLATRGVEVVAVESAPERRRRLAENLARLGLEARLVLGDAGAPAAWWDGRPFDRVLLDAPCSATGVIRRQPDVRLHRRPQDLPRAVRCAGAPPGGALAAAQAGRQATLCHLLGAAR
ncbi:MAG: hypothetical protein RML12_00435 [Xanthomonadales bacterium]|nr:hypothetical protein [Xanthomonadales bacterium]